MAPQVFAISSHPGTWQRQVWAAYLSEPHAAVGGLAAAALWGLDGARPGPVELVVPPRANTRNPLARLLRYDSPAVCELGGLVVTTIPQTLFDLARREPFERMERMLDGAVLGRSTTVAAVAERLRRYEGSRRAGLPLMRALILDRCEDGWVPPESELERVLRNVLRPLGLRLEWQVSFDWRDSRPARHDAFAPDLKAIIEADGRRWHARVQDFDRDRWRDNVVIAHGLRPLRFTHAHLTQRPDEVRGLLTDLVRLAA
jgi:very-short-patch-repair endonuclease